MLDPPLGLKIGAGVRPLSPSAALHGAAPPPSRSHRRPFLLGLRSRRALVEDRGVARAASFMYPRSARWSSSYTLGGLATGRSRLGIFRGVWRWATASCTAPGAARRADPDRGQRVRDHPRRDHHARPAGDPAAAEARRWVRAVSTNEIILIVLIIALAMVFAAAWWRRW